MSEFLSGSARMAALAAGVLALSAATGVAFAAWLSHAPDIFLALVETGLAWCF